MAQFVIDKTKPILFGEENKLTAFPIFLEQLRDAFSPPEVSETIGELIMYGFHHPQQEVFIHNLQVLSERKFLFEQGLSGSPIFLERSYEERRLYAYPNGAEIQHDADLWLIRLCSLIPVYIINEPYTFVRHWVDQAIAYMTSDQEIPKPTPPTWPTSPLA